jgi:CBS domain-containing membrane protein
MGKKSIKRSIRISKYVIYKETLVDYKELFWSFIGAFIGIGIIAFYQSYFLTQYETFF